MQPPLEKSFPKRFPCLGLLANVALVVCDHLVNLAELTILTSEWPDPDALQNDLAEAILPKGWWRTQERAASHRPNLPAAAPSRLDRFELIGLRTAKRRATGREAATMADMANGREPAVNEIRGALEDIPGAIRQDPLPEDVGDGTDRATPLWSPRGRILTEEARFELPDQPTDDDGLTDEPSIIFEVPPDLTEVEIQEVLGEEKLGNLKRLQEVRGVEALA